MDLILVAQQQTESLKMVITAEEPKLNNFEIYLIEQTEKLNKAIEETEQKKSNIAGIASEQAEKIEALKKLSDQINSEKDETEREKEVAIKLAERMTNKDLTELNAYTSPPESVSFIMKVIMILFDEEKEVKNKDDLSQWFFACRNKLLKNVNEFKERLKKRLISEEISEKQIKKLDPL